MWFPIGLSGGLLSCKPEALAWMNGDLIQHDPVIKHIPFAVVVSHFIESAWAIVGRNACFSHDKFLKLQYQSGIWFSHMVL